MKYTVTIAHSFWPYEFPEWDVLTLPARSIAKRKFIDRMLDGIKSADYVFVPGEIRLKPSGDYQLVPLIEVRQIGEPKPINVYRKIKTKR